MTYDDDDNVLVAAPATSISQFSDGYVDQYFSDIREILTAVFAMNTAEAAETVATFRGKAVKPEDGVSMVLFNASPLQVAADLGGAWNRPLSADEDGLYRQWKKSSTRRLPSMVPLSAQRTA